LINRGNWRDIINFHIHLYIEITIQGSDWRFLSWWHDSPSFRCFWKYYWSLYRNVSLKKKINV